MTSPRPWLVSTGGLVRERGPVPARGHPEGGLLLHHTHRLGRQGGAPSAQLGCWGAAHLQDRE